MNGANGPMGDIQTLAKGDGSRLVEPRRFLVRDRAAFTAVWLAHAGPDASVPPVDFEARMVAAVFAGERPSPGYEIEVAGTRRDGSTLTIIVKERSPDPGLIAAQIIVSPFHIVTVPRDDGEIQFDAAEAGSQTTIVFKPQRSSVPATRTRKPPAARSDWLADRSSSTGLSPEMAATMAYLAGPLSGALLLATERTSPFVRFHAWQAVFALGVLGTAALSFLVLAFLFLIVSPAAFWAMLWLAAASAVACVVVWAMCLLHAFRGDVWKLPLAGDYAERHATL